MADDMVEEVEEKQEILAKIEAAVRSRLQYFKDQSDSLTLGSVRRLLEKDLGLEKNSLDVHKRFISQYLEKQMEDAEDDNSKRTVENMEKDAHLNEIEDGESPKEHKTKKDPKEASNGDEETLEDSPVMGLLGIKSEVDNQGSVISESRIKKAIWDRADHFMANSENITLVGVRRLLEEDLGLDKNTLDPFKKLISEQIDQVLNSDRVSKNANQVKKKSSEKSQNKTSQKISSEKVSDSSDEESDKEKDKVKSRKQAAPREKDKKRKRSNKDSNPANPVKKQSTCAKRPKEEYINSDNDGSVSEDGQSQSSLGKPTKRKEQSTPGYGKRVDHLRSIIKSCGMSVAPTVYKKVKQAPDNKREAFLVKELEGILKREGLSSNPTEKEIKDCRKRKERAKELEGIDMSNIISSSRRRSTSSFMAPKSKVETKGNKDDVKARKHKDSKDKDGNDSDKHEETKGDDDVKAIELKNNKDKDGNDSDEMEETKGGGDDVEASKHKDKKDKDGSDGDEWEDKVEDDEKVKGGDEEEEEDDEEEDEEDDDDSSEEFNEDDEESD
ncbi:unnamed protein product [Fraxinus pennsylvanica]|uniref:Histone chaperone domain-containing protein n=1 Tax=Fraxinus pennsylvanica TaxID=56036 RepID=A0AAD2DZT0_9LAMI|nr:unnamed protein product [Fraxinus pennsylvanica]